MAGARPCWDGLGDDESSADLSRSSGPRVTFVAVPSLTGIGGLVGHRRTEAKRILISAIEDVDAVIVRVPSETGFLAARIARRLRKPLATEVAGCAWDEMWHHGTLQGKLYAPVRSWRMREAVRESPFAVYVTRAFLQHRYPTKGFEAIASNVEVLTGKSDVLERRLTRIDQLKKRSILGLLGSLQHRWKGIETALAALELVQQQISDFEFRILGPGDPSPWQQEAARRGLEGRVIFCGTRPSGEPVMEWLDDLDIYLQPSFQEGLPRALIEAMSRGCPAIGSTAGGIPELLPEECLHRPGDAERLARLITRAARDVDWQRLQARRNFQTAQRYDKNDLDAARLEFWRTYADHINQL